MNQKSLSGPQGLLLLVAVLVGTLLVLFHKSFLAEQALFANDGPLGVLKADYYKAPGGFFGVWDNLHWIGMYGGHFFVIPTYLLLWLFGPVGFAKFYVPSTVIVLGICAWIFFRRIGCNSRAAILASVAAALNMNFFSNAAWGLGTRGLSLGATFLALAAVETGVARPPIHAMLTSVLAGLAVGLSILEGGDNGGIFSLFVGFYLLFRTWQTRPSLEKKIAWCAMNGITVVVAAVLMASPTLVASFRIAGKKVVAPERMTESSEDKWDFATQWSLPKAETLRVIIPGLFGYRLDTPDGGAYWGTVGQYPKIPEFKVQASSPDPQTRQQAISILSRSDIWRSSGAGEYAGVMVILVGLWAIVESLRKGQTFSTTERKLILFWTGAAVAAMLLGWGRHGLLDGRLGFRWIHALPYFKEMRNAMKFFHAFHLCVMILFGYGLLGLSRRFLDVQLRPISAVEHLKAWWKKSSPEKSWTWFCIVLVFSSFIGWFGYMGSRSTLVRYLQQNGIPDLLTATQIAKFSANEVLIFAVVLTVCVALLTLVLSGSLAGPRAKWAGLLMGIVLVLDLARADMPWIIYYDWKEKYASNPIIDVLREHPYEQRVTMPEFQLNQQFGMLQGYYHGEWLQHQFPFYGVQSIDMPQDPHPAPDKIVFKESVKTLGRLWELTNTRYQFGLAGQFTDAVLNPQIDPVLRRFRQRTAFTLVRRENSEYATAQTNATGPFALIEFTGALPRVKLFDHWETIPDEKALLARLGDTNWNPHQTVLIEDKDAPKPTATAATPGRAEIVSTPSTKVMNIETASDTPAMLLLNDKIEDEWHAYVDGKQVPVLRANFLMRAVHLPAGTHKVTFRFETKPFLLVLGCDVLGLALVAFLAISAKTKRAAERSAKPTLSKA